MAKYLLTGAAGFIGSHVAHGLLNQGDVVVGVDNLNDAYDVRMKTWRLKQLEGREGFRFHKADISQPGNLDVLWSDEPYDAVLNLAARAGVRQSVRDPWVYFNTNIHGTTHLLEACRRMQIRKFVQASTSSLYGAHNPRPYREDADISRPLSPYAASKGASEMICHSYHHLYGIDITVLRYFTVFGPAGRPDMSIFRFIQWIAEERPVRIYGDGKQERDFTYVGDISRGTIAAIRPVGFEVINLGGDRPVSMLEVLHQIEALLDDRAEIQWHESAPADVRATWADIQKARRLLEWEPRVPFDEGLKSCVAWYLQEREWASQVNTSDD
jgi:nucleoside-diphosphate-sugar epimerase